MSRCRCKIFEKILRVYSVHLHPNLCSLPQRSQNVTVPLWRSVSSFRSCDVVLYWWNEPSSQFFIFIYWFPIHGGKECCVVSIVMYFVTTNMCNFPQENTIYLLNVFIRTVPIQYFANKEKIAWKWVYPPWASEVFLIHSCMIPVCSQLVFHTMKARAWAMGAATISEACWCKAPPHLIERRSPVGGRSLHWQTDMILFMSPLYFVSIDWEGSETLPLSLSLRLSLASHTTQPQLTTRFLLFGVSPLSISRCLMLCTALRVCNISSSGTN